jgi:hypothetical protein
MNIDLYRLRHVPLSAMLLTAWIRADGTANPVSSFQILTQRLDEQLTIASTATDVVKIKNTGDTKLSGIKLTIDLKDPKAGRVAYLANACSSPVSTRRAERQSHTTEGMLAPVVSIGQNGAKAAAFVFAAASSWSKLSMAAPITEFKEKKG